MLSDFIFISVLSTDRTSFILTLISFSRVLWLHWKNPPFYLISLIHLTHFLFISVAQCTHRGASVSLADSFVSILCLTLTGPSFFLIPMSSYSCYSHRTLFFPALIYFTAPCCIFISDSDFSSLMLRPMCFSSDADFCVRRFRRLSQPNQCVLVPRVLAQC